MSDMDCKKDLNYLEIPKRPLIGYLQFLRQHRPLVQKKYPKRKLSEIIKICAEDWKNLNQMEKEQYQQKYKLELEVYKDLLTNEQKQALIRIKCEKRKRKWKRILKKKRKEMNMPKRPIGSYMFYLKEKWALPCNRHKKPNKILKHYSKRWAALSLSEKAKYVRMHYSDKLRYFNEMAKWKKQMIKEGRHDLILLKHKFTKLRNPFRPFLRSFS